MTGGFPVKTDGQLSSLALRHTYHGFHPVGRGFELPRIDGIGLSNRHRSQHARQLAAYRPVSSERANALHQRHHCIASSPHTGCGHSRRHTGFHALVQILGCQNSRIPHHQRLSDGRIGLSQYQRLPTSRARRAQRNRPHPSRQRIQACIYTQCIQTGPSIKNRHGAVFVASRPPLIAHRAHTRLETRRGNHNHRLARHIADQSLSLAGQHHRHAAEQSSQFSSRAGRPHTYHTHAFMPTAGAYPMNGRSAAPLTPRRGFASICRQLQRTGTFRAACLTVAFRAAQCFTGTVLRNREQHGAAFQRFAEHTHSRMRHTSADGRIRQTSQLVAIQPANPRRRIFQR